MPFRVDARTVLQLGSELISSDAIAFYELIKNAFDAGSKRVEIRVVTRLPYDVYTELKVDIEEYLKHKGPRTLRLAKDLENKLRDALLENLNSAAPDWQDFKAEVSDAESLTELMSLVDESNFIEIKDMGEGMSLKDLDRIYLTIGTRARLKEKERQREVSAASDTASGEKLRPILGEKGVGRLSAMRLGNKLFVQTSKEGEHRWNILSIDWSLFSPESDKLVQEIEIVPYHGEPKSDSEKSGTTIRISALSSEWSKEKLQDIARDEFSKLNDPFIPSARYPIILKYNKEPISIPTFSRILFDQAHATLEAKFTPIGEPRLVGKINYRLENREKTFELSGAHLLTSAGEVPIAVLRSLGPFSMRMYWYNRRILTAVEGIGTLKQVRDLVAQWAGGLMVFRDGFRVNPYGQPDDDWLDLDRIALGSPGYKVNRRQIIGKVDITSSLNPRLVDQTNREGLRDSNEKRALVKLLQHVVIDEFKSFLDAIDNEVKAREPVSFDDFEERVEAEERQVQATLKLLLQRFPEVRKEPRIVSGIQSAVRNIRQTMTEAKQLAESYQEGRTQTLHLAGLGLMVEIVAHELNRATAHALSTLADAESGRLSGGPEEVFETLESQLKTLQKRLRILDPLSTSGRQTKENFDVVDWVKEILRYHAGQFERHGIRPRLEVIPSRTHKTLRIKAVKGMIVQILENLISNSVYWIKQEKKLNRKFSPQITITVDVADKEIRFTDNGPGIPPERKEEIFRPFFTTKPAGAGKGLGLFISKEIAEYNGCDLYLSPQPTTRTTNLNTFILTLEGSVQ